MDEILLPDCQFRRLSDGATCRDIQPKALCQACTAHVQVAALRTRLENAEVALREVRAECATAIEIGAQHYPERIGRIHGIATYALLALGVAGERSGTNG